MHPRPCGVAAEPTAYLTLSGARSWTAVVRDDFVLLIARTAAGRPDPSVNGGQPVEVWASPGARPIGVVPRPGGGALVFVTWGTDVNQTAGVAVVAIRADGRPDPTYTGDGRASLWVDTPYSSPDPVPRGSSRDALRLPDGRVRVCADMDVPAGGSTFRREVWLGGLTAAGERDTAVGPDGWRVLPGIEECASMVLDEQMRLLISGTGVQPSGRAFVAVSAWHAADGMPATTFGGDGVLVIAGSSRAYKAEAQRSDFGSDGRLYVGMASRDTATGARWIAAVARIDADGQLEADFGFGGVYRYGPTGSSRLTALAFSNGRLLLGLVYAGDGSRLLLARANGSTARLDGSFGRHGLVDVTARIEDVVVDGGGRILHAGQFERQSSLSPVILQRRGG